jgi:YrbI family 3-deoxy-D-manno-octulosonate 8-phosphate phosphatase
MKFTLTRSTIGLKDLELIAFDFDGIFTDDKVYVDQTGKESVACSRFDSLGIAKLLNEIERKNLKTHVIVISTETNSVVSARCEKMKLQSFTGISDKADFLRNYSLVNGLDLVSSLYAGNDLNDFIAMSLFGVRFAPANAHPRIRKLATHRLKSFGGNGFIRELIELIAPEIFADTEI